ncbi:MAG: flagellar biosynthetic protein FliO [Pirellulales bacterium]
MKLNARITLALVLLLVAAPRLLAQTGDEHQALRAGGPHQPGESSNRQASFDKPGASFAPRKLPAMPGARAADELDPIRLPPRADKTRLAGPEPARRKPASTGGSLLSGLGSLALVLGLFFITAWALRRAVPGACPALPAEVIEVLGRTALAGRQQAYLLRCGNKLLLVHLAAGSAETLTEITDPLEVDRLAGLCRQAHPHSASLSFRQILDQFGREKPAESFVDSAPGGAVAATEPAHV